MAQREVIRELNRRGARRSHRRRRPRPAQFLFGFYEPESRHRSHGSDLQFVRGETYRPLELDGAAVLAIRIAA
jgi:hypothetical protein